MTDFALLRDALRRIDLVLVALRRDLAHRHDDATWWQARGLTPAHAMQRRHRLRQVAHLLHVARATARGRRHGHGFASLDDQRAWLAVAERRPWWDVEAAGFADGTSLVAVRAALVAPAAVAVS